MAEQYDPDEMARNFVKAFNGLVFGAGQLLVFDFHGQNLKGTVRGVQLVDMTERAGAAATLGLVMDRTDINFIKAADSLIKIKASSKKSVNRNRLDLLLCLHVWNAGVHRTRS